MKNLRYKPDRGVNSNYFQKRNSAVRVMTGTIHRGRFVISADCHGFSFNSLMRREHSAMWGATMRTKDK